METAKSVITDILQEILVQASEQPIDAVDFEFVLRYMNRFMSELAVTTPLGYTVINTPADIITIPDGAINGLIFNVALRVVSSFDIAPSQLLMINAKAGLNAMRKLSRNLVSTRHPSTLPIGSGNYNTTLNSTFYSGETKNVLTEQGGSIILEKPIV